MSSQTKTASHSRPFAWCTVRSATASEGQAPRGSQLVAIELSLSERRGKSAGAPSNSFAASERAVTAASSSTSPRASRPARLERAKVLEPLPERVDGGARGLLALDDRQRLEERLELARLAQRAVERARLALESPQLERIRAEERGGEHAQRRVVVRGLPWIRGGELEQRKERVGTRVELGCERCVKRDAVAS